MSALLFGEILWDVFDSAEHLGGAPLNVASHLAKLGLSDVRPVSAVGNDERGQRAVSAMREWGVETDAVAIDGNRPTGHVSVHLDAKGTADYIIHEDVAWDAIPRPAVVPAHCQLFYFGSLAQRTAENRQTLQELLSATEPTHTFFDINLRQNYYSAAVIERSLQHCSIFKCNDEEIAVLRQLLKHDEDDDDHFVHHIQSAYDIPTVLVTAGASGVRCYHEQQRLDAEPASDLTIVDTVGAGDALSAGFCFALIDGKSIQEALSLGMRLADFVVGASGGTPHYEPDRFLD